LGADDVPLGIFHCVQCFFFIRGQLGEVSLKRLELQRIVCNSYDVDSSHDSTIMQSPPATAPTTTAVGSCFRRIRATTPAVPREVLRIG
jgi:hypothetical protein